MGGIKLQNQEDEEVLVSLRKKQRGKGYGAEGTCQAGNFVYAVVYFNVPLDTQPIITLSNFDYFNSSNAEVWQSSSFAFIVRATVTVNGGAGLSFDWSANV